MNRTTFLSAIKLVILLSPLPFGCVGRTWSPLFYLTVLLLTFSGLGPTISGPALLQETRAYEKRMRFFIYLIFAFLAFQVLPLPAFLVKLLSPGTSRVHEALHTAPSSFYPLSVLPGETLWFGLRLFVMVFFFYVLLKIKLQKNEIQSLVHVMILSAVIQVLFGLAKYIQGNTQFYLFFYPDANPGSRLTGTIANPDHFSFYLELILPLVIAAPLAASQFIRPGDAPGEKTARLFSVDNAVIKYLLPGLLIMAGIFLSGSRTGLTAALLSLFIMLSFIIYFTAAPHARHRFRWALAIIIVIITLMGLSYNLGVLGKSTGGGIDYAVIWAGSMKLPPAFPLWGAGAGTFKYIYFLYDPDGSGWVTHAHNEYLETFAELGIIGGLILLIPALWLTGLIFRLWWPRRSPDIKAMGLAALAACFIALFHSLYGFAPRIPAISFLIALIAAMGLQMVSYKRETGDRP
jgi:O-antigen ligase